MAAIIRKRLAYLRADQQTRNDREIEMADNVDPGGQADNTGRHTGVRPNGSDGILEDQDPQPRRGPDEYVHPHFPTPHPTPPNTPPNHPKERPSPQKSPPTNLPPHPPRIRNPFEDDTAAELMSKVDRLVTELNWPARDLSLLRLGAILAKHPRADLAYPKPPPTEDSETEHITDIIERDRDVYGELRPIDPDEAEHVMNERLNRWKQPRALYFTIGWDQTGVNSANLTWPFDLHIPTDNCILRNSTTPALPSFSGCPEGYGDNPHSARNFWLFGLINAAPYLSAAIIKTWQELLLCRFLLGLGMGAKATTVPIFAAESAPAQIRGALVMSWQMWRLFGQPSCLQGSGTSVAFTTRICLRPSGSIGYGNISMPRGRYMKAYDSLCRLRNSRLQAARDLFYVRQQLLNEEERLGSDSLYWNRLKSLFTKERVRRATLAAFVVMIAQQMCGINIAVFYSSTIFKEAGASYRSALLASFGFGLVNFVFAFPALITIDRWGRRTLLLFTFPNMAWTLLAAGLCFFIKGTKGAHLGLVTFFIYLFDIFYSPGEGPVPFTYSAEAFPLYYRVLFVPETKLKTLEDLDGVFNVSTRKFAKHQVYEQLPYWWKGVTGRERERPEPLYTVGNLQTA
ncbi:hypothetical protein FGG08_000563 [Glutinoglossum americanum]|uniref:Uncharacterized protein n=1 Tax=Glutinoglossum americanum TaxID=1670608 RepID=A0A9P8IGC7_9PEZI|nr:hypothetical protein FGG08_000563 [Glutinoglossum americanum]